MPKKFADDESGLCVEEKRKGGGGGGGVSKFFIGSLLTKTCSENMLRSSLGRTTNTPSSEYVGNVTCFYVLPRE